MLLTAAGAAAVICGSSLSTLDNPKLQGQVKQISVTGCFPLPAILNSAFLVNTSDDTTCNLGFFCSLHNSWGLVGAMLAADL